MPAVQDSHEVESALFDWPAAQGAQAAEVVVPVVVRTCIIMC